MGCPIRRFMHSVRKRSKTLFMSVAFYRWLSLFSHPVKPCPWIVADGTHPRALTHSYHSGPPWYAPKPLRIVRSLMCNDWPDHFQPMTSVFTPRTRPGRSRSYKKLRMLGSRSSRRSIKTVQLENGELTTKVAAGKLHSDPASLLRCVDFSILRVFATMRLSPSHKGRGPDLLPAELLKVSGVEGVWDC